ncbi:MAG: hypothetical protein OMOMHJEC_02692 [Xanthomonadales bacterium]|nr:hypothetical protein [Xanthomonadales bacterium]
MHKLGRQLAALCAAAFVCGGRHRAVGGRVASVACPVGGAVAVLGQECRVGAAAFVWVGDAAARLRAVAPSAHARGSR